jgi:peptidoglycan/LPS O-acetylase OafA/YrhL
MNGDVTELPERNLDLLRAAAVMSVLISHVAYASGLRDRMPSFVQLGRIGVAAFFVHTSLVLMGSLERHRTDHWVRDFYIRRAFRIYPLSIAAICFVLAMRMPTTVPVLDGSIRAFVPPSTSTVLSNLALAQNLTGRDDLLSVLWTLPLEVQMYVALPLCFLVARTRPRLLAGLLVAGMTMGAAQAARPALFPGFWRLTTLPFVPCFIAGVIAYALLRRRPSAHLAPTWWPPLLFAWIGMACWGFDRVDGGSVPWPSWIFCVGLGLAIPYVSNIAPGRFATACGTIAKYSYGIYLLHVPALWIGLVVFRGFSHAVQWTVFLVVLVTTTVLGYHLIEKPGISLGVRLVRPRAPVSEVAPAV